MNLKNTESGTVHANGADYVKILKKISLPLLCGGNTFYDVEQSYTETEDAITCKTCLRVIESHVNKEETPPCICSEYGQLETLTELAMEKLRADVIKDLNIMIKDHKANLPIKLEKKALEFLKFFVEKHANIYEGINVKSLITDAFEEYIAYLKEPLF